MVEILYQDREIVTCIKEPGMDAEQDVPNAIKEALGGNCYTVHRLDKNVGGVMVYARTAAAAGALSRLIGEGTMVKEYVACVHGAPEIQGVWEDLLFRDSRMNKVFVVKKPRAGVRDAKLAYRVLEQGETSLVQVRLYTGRSHQIRVQFASRGFPLVGDHKYGSRSREISPMLFSCRIRFPWKGKPLCFSALPVWAQGKGLADMD